MKNVSRGRCRSCGCWLGETCPGSAAKVFWWRAPILYSTQRQVLANKQEAAARGVARVGAAQVAEANDLGVAQCYRKTVRKSYFLFDRLRWSRITVEFALPKAHITGGVTPCPVSSVSTCWPRLSDGVPNRARPRSACAANQTSTSLASESTWRVGVEQNRKNPVARRSGC